MKIIVSCQMSSSATEMKGTPAINGLPEWKRVHDHLEHPYKLGLIACAMRTLGELTTMLDNRRPSGARPWGSQIVAAIDYAEHAELTLSIGNYNGAGDSLPVGSWFFGISSPAESMRLRAKGVEYRYDDEDNAAFLLEEIKRAWAKPKARRRAA
ncbi:MAG TPA: hypothetical protein VJJ47_00470 [Candidatus Paceibacterota bacterium]